MTAVTVSVACRDEVSRRALAAFRGDNRGAHISFASLDLLWDTLTRSRWDILQAMTGEGEISIREVAGRVGRDVASVESDLTALVHGPHRPYRAHRQWVSVPVRFGAR